MFTTLVILLVVVFAVAIGVVLSHHRRPVRRKELHVRTDQLRRRRSLACQSPPLAPEREATTRRTVTTEIAVAKVSSSTRPVVPAVLPRPREAAGPKPHGPSPFPETTILRRPVRQVDDQAGSGQHEDVQ